MVVAVGVLAREEVEFFLRLHGLWEGLVRLPRPPPPPFDIENVERNEPSWRAIKEWIAVAPLWPCRMQDPPPDPDGFDQRQTWKPAEIHLEDGRILVLNHTC